MNTLVTTYYENPELLEIFIENNFNQDYFSNLIVVDDASSKYPAKDILQHYDTSNISLFVLTEDVGFNGHAARNLAAYQTKTKWITFLDVDTTLAPKTFDYIKDFVAEETECFLEIWFNQFLIPRNYFLASGGYDERLNGYHWGDFLFLQRLYQLFSFYRLDYTTSVLNIKPKEPDTIKKNELEKLSEKVFSETSKNPLDWHKHKILTFDWKKICL